MSSTDSRGVPEGVARDKLQELREEGGVLVAQVDLGGDEIRHYENHDTAEYQVRAAVGGKPRFYAEEEMVELIRRNAYSVELEDDSGNDSKAAGGTDEQ